MQRFFNKIPKSYKDGFLYSASIIAIAETIFGIAGFSLKDILPKVPLTVLILVTIISYVGLALIIRFLIKKRSSVSFKIRNINFNIKIGDIFKEKGVKIIPFNEHFDTVVDDKIISKNSLNGTFILKHVLDIQDLQTTINNCEKVQDLNGKIINDKIIFPLGRIIKYKEYLLLSFSHFNDNNVAHITKIEYEKCLSIMWKEIRRTYSGEIIILPLLGAGITQFDDISEKFNFDLLKCIICTFKSSDVTFINSINIVVTENVWNDLRLHDRLDALII